MDIHKYVYLIPTSKPASMTSLMIDILSPWMPETDKQRTTVVVREVGTKAV